MAGSTGIVDQTNSQSYSDGRNTTEDISCTLETDSMQSSSQSILSQRFFSSLNPVVQWQFLQIQGPSKMSSWLWHASLVAVESGFRPTTTHRVINQGSLRSETQQQRRKMELLGFFQQFHLGSLLGKCIEANTRRNMFTTKWEGMMRKVRTFTSRSLCGSFFKLVVRKQ